MKSYLLAAIVASLSAHAATDRFVPGRILVKAHDAASPADVKAALQAFGGVEDETIPNIGIKVVRVPARALSAALQGLQHNPHIEFAEPDYIVAPDAVTNDPYFGSEWHLSKIGADLAWNTTIGSSSIVIAILDTGVDGTHPDLAPKLVAGWNFYDGNSDTSDVYGHGTAVAGSAAAIANNGVGVAGIAPNCSIMPIRISDVNGYAYDSTISKALSWAADHGARVANISFRASNFSSVRSAAQYFQNKGGVVTISAGNDGVFDSNLDNPYALTVSATDQNDALASWSNTGNNVDLAAPGVDILTTSRGGTYGWWSGTSFSAPIVAGTAALVLSVDPTLTGAAAADILKKSASDLGSLGFDTQYGFGRVNAANAVALALQPGGVVTDTTAPTIQIVSPAQGSRVGTSTTVSVSAADNVGVVKVQLYVDGQLVTTSSTAPFTTKWNSRRAYAGAHQIQTRAYDAAGNNAFSQVVTVYR